MTDDEWSKGDWVRAEPVVGPAAGGAMHEVIHGQITAEIGPDQEPFIGEDVVVVEQEHGETHFVRRKFVYEPENPVYRRRNDD